MIGRNHVVAANKRISLCHHVRSQTDSEDEHEIPSRDVSAFGSAESEETDFGERPTPACLSDAAAVAVGNSPTGERCIPNSDAWHT